MNYDHVLPFTPPVGPDLYFYRGQFCGLRVAGAPVVPGSNPDNPECVMACLLDNYPKWVQDEFLRLYCGYGYTHLQRSLGHALGYGATIDQFNELSKRAQRLGLFADVWFIANEFPGFEPNRDASFWGPKLEPFIDSMLAASAIDVACPCWQMDQIMQGAPGNATISIIAYVANKLPGTIPVFTHWMNDALAWWKTGGEVWTDPQHWPTGINVYDRFTFWLAMQPYLTGAHYQGNTTMARTDPQTFQGHLRDTLNPFNDGKMGYATRRGFGEKFRLLITECTAQDQFNGTCSELEGDGVGYLLTCTKGDHNNGGVMSGYGNGARMPDGSAL